MKELSTWDDDGGRPINPDVMEAATCGASLFKVGDRVVCVSAPKEWYAEYAERYLNKTGTITSHHDDCSYCEGTDFSILFDGNPEWETVALGVENMSRRECSQCHKSVPGIKVIDFGMGLKLECCPDCYL